MDELVRWLGEQLDEDEQIARATDQTLGQRNLRWSVKPVDEAFFRVVAAGHYVVGTGEFNPEDAHHIAKWDPARVLREIDAKRQALAHYLRVRERAVRHETYDEPYDLAEGAVFVQIKYTALPYADRPGYREEWRP